MHGIWWLTMVGQTPVDSVGPLSASLERGGLYTIIAILLVTVAFLYRAKESQRVETHKEVQAAHAQHLAGLKEFQDRLLKVVEGQTAVMTKQVLLTERVEQALVKVNARLEDHRRSDA